MGRAAGSTSADSSSPSAAVSDSAKPLVRADLLKPLSSTVASARRTASARSAGPASGLASLASRGDVAEDVVEGADSPGEKRGAAGEQVTLDEVDVCPVRDDQPGVAVQLGEEAFEQQRHLPGVRRPDDQGEPHRAMVIPTGVRPLGA